MKWTDKSVILPADMADGDLLPYADRSEAEGEQDRVAQIGGLIAHFTNGGDALNVPQVAHGLAVGQPVRHNGSAYVLATADTETNAEWVGIVKRVDDVDNLTIAFNGYHTGFSGLTAGSIYYLQDDGTFAVTPGTVEKKVFQAVSVTEIIIFAGGGGGGGEEPYTVENKVPLRSTTVLAPLAKDGSVAIGSEYETFDDPAAIRFTPTETIELLGFYVRDWGEAVTCNLRNSTGVNIAGAAYQGQVAHEGISGFAYFKWATPQTVEAGTEYIISVEKLWSVSADFGIFSYANPVTHEKLSVNNAIYRFADASSQVAAVPPAVGFEYNAGLIKGVQAALDPDDLRVPVVTTAQRDALGTAGLGAGETFIVSNSDTGQVEYWDGAAWVAVAAASINSVGDVDTATTAPTDGQALVWNASTSKWEPGDVASGGAAEEVSVLLTHSVAQSAATGTQTALAFDTEEHDPDGLHDPATNNTRITFTAPGRYVLTAAAMFATSGTGIRQLSFRKNGTTYYASNRVGAPSSDVAPLITTVVVEVIAGDYFEVMAMQGSGGALDVTGQRFTAHKIGGGSTSTALGAVRAHKTALQSIPNNTWTKVTFDTEDYDVEGDFATSTYTARRAGIYRVSAALQFTNIDDLASGYVVLYKNGARAVDLAQNQSAGTGIQGVSGTTEIQLAAGDTLEIYAYQDSAAARDIRYAADANNWVAISYVGAAA